MHSTQKTFQNNFKKSFFFRLDKDKKRMAGGWKLFLKSHRLYFAVLHAMYGSKTWKAFIIKMRKNIQTTHRQDKNTKEKFRSYRCIQSLPFLFPILKCKKKLKLITNSTQLDSFISKYRILILFSNKYFFLVFHSFVKNNFLLKTKT